MTLAELTTAIGPVGAVLVFMWLNRGPNKSDKPDPIAQKLDAMLEEMKGQRMAFSDFSKTLAILMDRSDR